MYIDKAINAILDSDKSLMEAGKTIDDIRTMKIVLVDQLENIMLGLGKVEKGKDENGVSMPYQRALDEAQELLNSEKFEGDKVGLQRGTRFANLRFQILLNALKKDKPANVEFSG